MTFPVLPRPNDAYKKGDIPFFVKVSKMIIKELPNACYRKLVGPNVQSWSTLMKCTEEEVQLLISILISFWTYVAFYKIRGDSMREILNETFLSKELTQAVADMWEKERLACIRRLGKMTLTDDPIIEDVEIVTETEVANDYSKNQNIPKATLKLTTTIGPHSVSMSRSEATTLFLEIDRIQQVLDKYLVKSDD